MKCRHQLSVEYPRHKIEEIISDTKHNITFDMIYQIES